MTTMLFIQELLCYAISGFLAGTAISPPHEGIAVSIICGLLSIFFIIYARLFGRLRDKWEDLEAKLEERRRTDDAERNNHNTTTD